MCPWLVPLCRLLLRGLVPGRHGSMETKHGNGQHFHSPLSNGRNPCDRIMGSVSPAELSSPLTDPLVYEYSEYGTSGPPSFSSSQDLTPGRDDGEQDAFLPSTDILQSISEWIRNIALRKLYHLGYVKGVCKGADGEMVIRCVKCDDICLGKRAAVNHIFTFHPEVEPYDCQLCASSFHAKNSLRLHYVVAHISKRMTCDVCGKRFSDPHLFKSHRLFHELESYVCGVCGQQFSSYFGYKTHTRSHQQQRKKKKKHKCGFCLKHFYTEKTYWEHMDCHNGSRTYDCSRCNETFTEKLILAEHWSSHEDELPCFLCTGCDWLYYTKKQRLKHWRTVRNWSQKSVKKLLQTFTQSKQSHWNVTTTL